MTTKNLLVELFVEELPPKALKRLGESFAATLSDSLKAQGLAAAAAVTAFASPRRLAVHVANVAAKAADKPVSQKLMPVSVGLDANGNATPALLKRLAGLGAGPEAVAQLKRAPDGKNEALFYDSLVAGATLVDGLQKALEEALAKLPIPKVMGYQLADGWSTVNFVRPAHGLVALHGSEIVPISVLGLNAGNTTQGHRFEAINPTVTLKDADSYAEQLATEGAVIASFEARRAEIVRQLAAAAQGLKPIEDDALLDEVTALVERPNVLLGQFEEAFLEVPQECLILTMKANQKYFPLLDASGRLTNKFLIVSNIRPADPSLVIGGNERVVRPRLADAKFFFDQDRKHQQALRVSKLGNVVYHNKLGAANDMLSRSVRVAEGAEIIAGALGGGELVNPAGWAAILSKVDLLSDMVGEFPELQGIMGRYYAQYDGLPDDIAYAIEDHYKPRFAGDELPRNIVGVCVALADKFETLVGLFGIGDKPTGDKDPFGLRRQALGAIRILSECNLTLSLDYLIQNARTMLTSSELASNAMEKRLNQIREQVSQEVLITRFEAEIPPLTFVNNWQEDLKQFIFDRFAGLLREKGFSAQEIESVLSMRPNFLNEVPARLAAVRNFTSLPEASTLAAANKRVGNILKKVEGEVGNVVDAALLQEAAEQALHQALSQIAPQANAAFERGDYTASLQALAALRAPVDAFFDNVMVNADDPALRANRLALLAQLHGAMNRVADLSKLAA